MDVPKSYTKAQLAQAMKQDKEMGRARLKMGDLRVGKTGRLARQISTTAFFNAVNQEGPEVATADGAQYFRDQERLYPWIGNGRGGGPVVSANGMVNRFGRVKEKLVFRGGKLVTLRRNERGELVAG
jgi:hypothetical protein